MTEPHYVLGSHAEELARLDHQAAAIERPTRMLLHAAGIVPGMRVLDLGTGLGHVARLVGELVGATGQVVGIDQSAEALAVAGERTTATGANHVTFVEANATTWRGQQPFDAIVTRLLLFHVADPVSVIRHHQANLRPGGLFVAIDFDIGGARAEPPVDIVSAVGRWIEAGFRAGGSSPRVGARLGPILDAAGLERVSTFGLQTYFRPGDPTGPAMFSGVVRSLAPTIISRGIATAEELDLPHLDQRIADEVARAGAVVLPPTVVGAWGVVPSR